MARKNLLRNYANIPWNLMARQPVKHFLHTKNITFSYLCQSMPVLCPIKIPDYRSQLRRLSMVYIVWHSISTYIWKKNLTIFTNPSIWEGYDTRSISSGVSQVWIQSFPSPRLVASPRLKTQSALQNKTRFNRFYILFSV